ncbi:hypothetical protein Gain_0031_024 [Komagataeibacter intermedius TF2]|uniref:Uncharacterized protein n=1 Tax=Komagataeibacter intermedius NRIC 0521 TaxID=1307934 RepID=A0ABQ0PMZ6_9PROT|nr:hypothetical protein Gain_0031_024 [Komagataeibacter intermedius TF2]GBQ76273.1 hypothetical protein AA0521_2858 [Komagataeibacter intermedius NRIC 0521]
MLVLSTDPATQILIRWHEHDDMHDTNAGPIQGWHLSGSCHIHLIHPGITGSTGRPWPDVVAYAILRNGPVMQGL